MSSSRVKFDKLVFGLVILDLTLFPYVRFLNVSFSMLILPLWYFFRGSSLINDAEFKVSVILIGLAVSSFLLALINYSNGFLLRDGTAGSVFTAMAPNTAIIIFLFLYYIFFKNVIVRIGVDVKKYLLIYLFFLAGLAGIYMYDPSLYFEVRSFWTMSGNVVEIGEMDSTYRFTGTLSDPNNLSAIVCSVLAYLLFCSRLTHSVKFVFLLICMFIVVSSMSSSGVAFFLFVAFLYSLKFVFLDSPSINSFLIRVLSGFLFVCFGVLVFVFLQNTEIGEIFVSRVESNSMDSRYAVWYNVFKLEKIIYSFLWGDGGAVVQDGIVVNPHNGHLHLIYSYGLIFYLAFVCLFFRFSRVSFLSSVAVIFPLFMCFTINVGIYELRFVGVMALLLASLRYFKSPDGVLKVTSIRCV